MKRSLFTVIFVSVAWPLLQAPAEAPLVCCGGTAALTTANASPLLLARPDTAFVFRGQRQVSIPVLGNDESEDAAALSVAAVDAPPHGNASILADRITYDSKRGFSGIEQFGYTVAAATGQQQTGKITVHSLSSGRSFAGLVTLPLVDSAPALLRIKLSAAGSFTGTLSSLPVDARFRGVLSSDGKASLHFAGSPDPVEVLLTLADDAATMGGTIKSGTLTSVFYLNSALPDLRAVIGRKSLRLNCGVTEQTPGLVTTSAAVFHVRPKGTTRFAGRLANRQSFSAGGAFLESYGTARIYAKSGPKLQRGSISGRLTVATRETIDGVLDWIRPTTDAVTMAGSITKSDLVVGLRNEPPLLTGNIDPTVATREVASIWNGNSFGATVLGEKQGDGTLAAIDGLRIFNRSGAVAELFFNDAGQLRSLNLAAGGSMLFDWISSTSARVIIRTPDGEAHAIETPITLPTLAPRNTAAEPAPSATAREKNSPRGSPGAVASSTYALSVFKGGKPSQNEVVEFSLDPGLDELTGRERVTLRAREISPGLYAVVLPDDLPPVQIPTDLIDWCQQLADTFDTMCKLADAAPALAALCLELIHPGAIAVCEASIGIMLAACKLAPPGEGPGTADIICNLIKNQIRVASLDRFAHVDAWLHSGPRGLEHVRFGTWTPGAPSVTKTIDLGDAYFARLSNVDDEATFRLNGTTRIRTNYAGDSGWVDITNYMIYVPGVPNRIYFEVRNTIPNSGWTYGFSFRKNDEVIYGDSCGTAGVAACRGQNVTPVGLKFDYGHWEYTRDPVIFE